jgi:hypothetical protein
MVAPSGSAGNGQSFDVLLRFITDLVGEDNVKALGKDMSDLQKQVDASAKSISNAEAFLRRLNKELSNLKSQQATVRQGSTEWQNLGQRISNVTETIRFQNNQLKETKALNKDLTEELNKQARAQQQLEANGMKALSVMSRASGVLNGISNSLVIGGTAITGTLLKAANDYINSLEVQNELSREWKAANDSVKQSYAAIGQVAASEILPFLQQGAALAERIAGFLQQNPEIVGAAVRIGLIALTLGVIGKALAGGIKLVADTTTIAASATNLLASTNNLLAAGGMQTAATTFAATISVVLLPALVILAGILSGVLVGLLAYEAIAKNSNGALPDLETLGTQTLTILKAKTKELFGEFNMGIDEATAGVSEFTDKTKELVQAFAEMREQEAEARSKYQAEVRRINDRANSASIKAAQDSANRIKQINQKADADRASIISRFTSESATEQANFEAERAKIIRDGGLEIQRIEEDRLEKVRKLTMDHNEREADLAANRDALGLVLNQRRFDREREEIDRATNLEVAKRRQDIAVRLQDQANQFALERQQKRAQFLQDLKDNAEKRKADLEAERDAAAQRQREIAQQRSQELREAASQHREEMRRIRQAFIDKVRDLDASLLNEQNRKRQAYATNLRDLESFLAQERALRRSGGGGSTGSGTSPRGFSTGGYAFNELIQTHGKEFIAKESTTRQLERMIGGRITQQNLVGAVAAGTGAGSSIIWNDTRRFSGEYTKSMRRSVQQDTFGVIRNAFSNIRKRRKR